MSFPNIILGLGEVSYTAVGDKSRFCIVICHHTISHLSHRILCKSKSDNVALFEANF